MRKAFTLIEILVVISIIAILIAILLPVLSSTRYDAANFLCLNRQKQWVIATTAYCADNDGFYPDRGIITKSAQPEPLWARWAARMYIDKNVDGNLDEILGRYVSEEVPLWVCPQYDGEHDSGALAGCLEHGKGHSNDRWTTYAFHGGLSEFNNIGRWKYNPGDRRSLGEPYVIESLTDGSTVYESRLLISDTASDDNSWVPCYYPNQTGKHNNKAPFEGITTNHQPKPGTLVQQVNNPGYRVQGVGGPTHTNWAFDDGSAETRVITPGNHLLSSDEWTAISSDAGRYMLFPN
jgi:prepilin-type N-terminal cleavage/methylation domain-containing protein